MSNLDGRRRTDDYDVVVVGGRVAGASTALLLARAGHRVLVVDRVRFPADTLSTHLVWPAGVVQLRRWGLLEAIVATGAPALSTIRNDVDGVAFELPVWPESGVGAVYAPRRTVLDLIVLNAAEAAGADVLEGVTVDGLARDGTGRVAGVVGHRDDGGPLHVGARVVVGADGWRSRVAREAGALAEGIPGADLVVLEGRDHLVYVDQEPVLDAVEEFVTGSTSASAPDRVLTTVLFANVAEPTEPVQPLGDVARGDLARFRGNEVPTTGGGLLATFDGPARAVRCGQSLQRSAARLGLPLCIGVHTTEVERLGDGIAGVGVHIGARVAATATRGEVWVTRTVRDLVAGSGLQFDPRGTHTFSGIGEPWALYAAHDRSAV